MIKKQKGMFKQFGRVVYKETFGHCQESIILITLTENNSYIDKTLPNILLHISNVDISRMLMVIRDIIV